MDAEEATEAAAHAANLAHLRRQTKKMQLMAELMKMEADKATNNDSQQRDAQIS